MALEIFLLLRLLTTELKWIQQQFPYVPTFNGCAGPEVSFDFIINPVLEVNEIPDTILCANEEFPGIIFDGNVPNANYTWTNNNTSIGLGSNGIGDIVNFISVNSVQ